MKKILVVSEGANFSKNAFEFACKLNEEEPILLTGIFLPTVLPVSLWTRGMNEKGAGFSDEEKEEIMMQENINWFEDMCIQNNIEYKVHKDFEEFSFTEFEKETRFADLALISDSTFYNNKGLKDVSEYLEDAFRTAECSVIFVPEKSEFPTKNIITYDGSKSSVFAIKQFIYLMPHLLKNETILLYAKKGEEKTLPDHELIEEYTRKHFPNLTLCKLDDDDEKFILSTIEKEQNAIVISGAFGRSSFSLFFKKSFMNHILTDLKVPVFISHK